MSTLVLLLVLCIFCITTIQRVHSQESNLLQMPSSLTSTNGLLSANWTLQAGTFNLSSSKITVTTRLFNGQYPGPTLRISPGDKLQLNFSNSLSDQNAPFVHNGMSAPDETNLHFHGLHVSGELPSDDPLIVIGPGESFVYETVVPREHLGGTHWMHPHRHGSTTVSLSLCGLALFVIRRNAFNN
jgi:FtsP/CotA-like multicopper oxidase with cupredoxin domain